tara:strand:- start:9578 stop:9853 length:276 start_codon:yes stop_codon:yes gene_type:complete
MKVKITYDDTRDIAINLVAELQALGHIKSDKEIDKDNDEGINYFEIQDTIHNSINEKLGLDIDDNFEIIITQTNKEVSHWEFDENGDNTIN